MVVFMSVLVALGRLRLVAVARYRPYIDQKLIKYTIILIRIRSIAHSFAIVSISQPWTTTGDTGCRDDCGGSFPRLIELFTGLRGF